MIAELERQTIDARGAGQTIARRRIYMVRLTRPKSPTLRYRCFEVVSGELRRMWPSDAHMLSRAALLPFQRFSTREGYDAFHFQFAGGEVTPPEALARALAQLWKLRVDCYDITADILGSWYAADERGQKCLRE